MPRPRGSVRVIVRRNLECAFSAVADDLGDQFAEHVRCVIGVDLAGARREMTAAAVAEHQAADVDFARAGLRALGQPRESSA